jgi:hypothetical protein
MRTISKTVKVADQLTSSVVTLTVVTGQSFLSLSITDQTGQPVTHLKVSRADANQIAGLLASATARAASGG